jgi:hypothetical protein
MKFLRVLLTHATCLAAFGLSLPAFAADEPAAAGMIKRLQGTVTLERAGKNVPVAVGTVVQVGDRIRTAPRSAVGIALADDTLLSAGPGSELVVSTFAFDTTSHEGSVVARLLRGTLHVVTGLVGKAKPQNVQIQTPTVVLGVRGTEFVVETEGSKS